MARKIAVALIDLYRKWVSPLLPPSCRFHPSCSAYAREAYLVHGAFKGTALTLLRLLKCHPLHPGGLDPVPTRFPARKPRRVKEE